jgi:hypothetical protein
MFSPEGDYSNQKKRVFEKISSFFERFNLLG